MAANKLIPSVVTGNTVVVKPSPYTPLSTAMLSEMAVEAFPAVSLHATHSGHSCCTYGQQCFSLCGNAMHFIRV